MGQWSPAERGLVFPGCPSVPVTYKVHGNDSLDSGVLRLSEDHDGGRDVQGEVTREQIDHRRLRGHDVDHKGLGQDVDLCNLPHVQGKKRRSGDISQ